ncbi:hypothetical protein BDV93DRAFT_555276 [Ceratobasidium sp. AG-I]|nr:hypothetical protein BDV93DRAFT_555276 [Ceratobasidium sp. AG-I]
MSLRVAQTMSYADVSKPGMGPAYGSNSSIGGRSTLALERQINELTETFAEYKHASEATLARILEAVGRIDPAINPARAHTPFLTTSSSPLDIKPVYSNPPPSPELVATISKVVSEARSRVGKKKGGADDNSCKEHARNSFYRMLGIAAASDIRPYFEDSYGEPDTLPSQFVDPDTNYCRPYPHWKTSLAKQPAWVPTYILRFRSTIPNDQSKLSTMLRGLSDEQILVLLNDGPFKSACTAWRNMKKTDTDIEAMRSSARKYQRCDRKAGVRGVYIQTIPSLLGSEWEYLYNPGYVSPDESDEEGVLVTKQPAYRARWETNLYEAIQVAEREKGRARPGLYPRLPSTRIETVRRPIPHLERGTGSGKVTIRIALCGLSKSWRKAYPDEIQKSTHLLNMKAVTKPDISAFLAKHPMPEIDSSESVKDEPQPDYEPDDMELWAFGTQVEGQLGEGYGGVAHIPIDPALLCEDARHDGQHSGAEVWPLSSASKNMLGAPPPSFDMPPPPPLSNNAASAEVGTAVVNETSAKGKTKEQAAGVEGSVDTDAVPAAPKRRRRPRGSKNKPKEAVA